MASRRQLNRIWTIWPDVTALLKEWKAFIERADSWSWGEGFHVDDGEGGRTVNFIPQGLVKIAKCGGTDIDPMTGTAPGVGEITLYTFDGTDLIEDEPDLAYNLHPTEPVTADAWIKVIKIDGEWWVFWEPCS